ncbi:MAG: TonB-dependent siderophore receptor [Gammaproteobacteria bacterium]
MNHSGMGRGGIDRPRAPRSSALVRFAAAVLLGASAAAAYAQTFKLDLPRQNLESALVKYAEATGIQLLYSARLTRGLKSTELSGEYSPEDGLRRLLEGTGLAFRFTDAKTVTISTESAEKSTRVLGPVKVEGQVGATGASVAGVNGSTDATATEGTKSYTSSALSIGSKAPESMRETPQSVSAITQQRMQDQNLTSFGSMMNQATGVTLVTGGNNLSPTYYARGFVIRSIQVDGGAPLSTAFNFLPMLDMAMYDHVEILRGADGLFSGYGDPSGTVNLSRKRPLDHAQTSVELATGSWSNYRAVVDATAPLGFEGRLRGRAVISYQDQNFFYDVSSSNHTLTYGVLEADLTPSTVVSAGVDFNRVDARPFINGLPRYENGDDLWLSRGTCLCFNWSRWGINTQDVFAQLEQQLGENWSAKVKLNRNHHTIDERYGRVSGTVNPITLTGPVASASTFVGSTIQTLADFTVSGAFTLFGHRQEILLGGSYADDDGADGGRAKSYNSSSIVTPPINVFAFNPTDLVYSEPAASPPNSYLLDNGQSQWFSYLTLRLTPFDRLHFVSGLRYSHYESKQHQIALNTKTGAVIGDYSTYWSGHDLSWPPTYSMIYDVSKTLSAYASYTDIYQSQARYLDTSGNPIGPETGSNIEVGLKFESAGGKLNGTLSAYQIEQKGFGVQVGYGDYPDTQGALPDGVHYCCYLNGHNQVNSSRGVDAEMTGEVLPGLQLFAGYTYNENTRKGAYYGINEGTPLVSLSPKHLLKLWSSYRFTGGDYLHRLSVSAGVNAQTSSFNSGSACTKYEYGTDPVTGNPTAKCLATANYAYTQKAYAVVGGRVSYQIDQRWNAALNMDNILDRTYYKTMGSSTGSNWYGDPRNYMLTVRGSF